MDEDFNYIPPLVLGNKLPEFVDYHSTIEAKKLNVGGYIRISTKKDSQLTLIVNQKKIIKEWTVISKL